MHERHRVAGAEREAILVGVRQVAREHLGWTGPVDEQQPLVETLGLDSLKLLTLVVEIENHFRICLDEDSEALIVTVGDLVDEIGSKLERSDRHSA